MCINLCIASKKVYKRLFEKYSLCKRNLFMNIKLDENVLFKCIYVSLCYSSWHQRSCMSIGDKTTRISGRWGEFPRLLWPSQNVMLLTYIGLYTIEPIFTSFKIYVAIGLIWRKPTIFHILVYMYVQPHLHYSTDLVFMEIHCTVSCEEKNQHL